MNGRVANVAVVIPTLGRPDSLERALRSLALQTGVRERLESVVVVDNDPGQSAAAVCQRISATTALPLVYLHAPSPGVATARNAGLQATSARLIAFLDDDEAAQPGWLAALLDTHLQFGADVTFGPIQGCAPDAEPKLRSWLESFFSRCGPEKSGLLTHWYGCGNSLVDRGLGRLGQDPFRPRQDETGGEDDVLFAQLQAGGGRFAWASDAKVIEFAPAHRARVSYALTRAFAHGQSPCQAAARSGRLFIIPLLMAIGAVQALGCGGLGAALWLVRRPEAWPVLERAARGAGKLLWFEMFEPRLYGQAEIRRLARAQRARLAPDPRELKTPPAAPNADRSTATPGFLSG